MLSFLLNTLVCKTDAASHFTEWITAIYRHFFLVQSTALETPLELKGLLSCTLIYNTLSKMSECWLVFSFAVKKITFPFRSSLHVAALHQLFPCNISLINVFLFVYLNTVHNSIQYHTVSNMNMSSKFIKYYSKFKIKTKQK